MCANEINNKKTYLGHKTNFFLIVRKSKMFTFDCIILMIIVYQF